MKVVEIIFSPTGGTEKAARLMAEQWSGAPAVIDLCASAAEEPCEIAPDDLVLIAMPSFGGRAPELAMERLSKIQGNGARCVLLCVYGNREFEDTLAHMADGARSCGFKVIGGVSAIAEHSIARQYAAGRPDAADGEQLAAFAKELMDKDTEVSSIPGNVPAPKPSDGGMAPQPGEGCVKCGLCAKKCPAQAIDRASLRADPAKCISCMRCVKVCPKAVRTIGEETLAGIAQALKPVCSERKENKLFL